MDVKLVSCQQMVPKLSRDFGLKPSDWVADFIEWVAEGIEIIGCGGSYILGEPLEIEVCEFKAKLPCPVDTLLGVKYNNKRLPHRNGVSANDTTFLKTLPINIDHYYTLNGNYMNTSFEKGTITLYYMKLSTDEEGYPCIPDRAKAKNALGWYIMKQLLSKGYTHPVFTYVDAEQRWEKFYPQAQNDLKMSGLDKRANFKNHVLQLVPNVGREDGFFQDM